MPRGTRSFAAVLTLLLLTPADTIRAQTNDDIFAGLQFSFTPPGARSLATGGAFAGRADDATAAYSNPAGLLWLEEPEVSLEVRSSSFSTPYVDGGRLAGDPTFRGIDTLYDPRYSNFTSDTSGVSFLSYVHTLDSGKWALALYRHELANFEVSIESQGVFRPVHGQQAQSGAMRGALDLHIDNLGVSGAYRLSRSFWLGLGVSLYRIEVDGLTRRFEAETVFEPARFSPEMEFVSRRLTGNDNDPAIIGGLLWSTHNRRWSVGAVYREGPKFDSDTTFAYGPLASARQRVDPALAASRSGSTNFHVPDVLAAGFSVRPTPATTISFEYDRVRYSNLRPEKNVLTRSDRVLGRFQIDDGNELHLGIEHVMLALRSPLALRIGAWTDPDHQLRFSPPTPTDEFTVRYHAGDDIIHLTGGVGLVVKEGKFQFDLAFSTSDRVDILSFSGVATL